MQLSPGLLIWFYRLFSFIVLKFLNWVEIGDPYTNTSSQNFSSPIRVTHNLSRPEREERKTRPENKGFLYGESKSSGVTIHS